MVEKSSLAQLYGKSQSYMDIPNKWYKGYNVKRDLGNEDGIEVQIGLTRVADVVGYEEVDEGIKAVPGRLLYRGVDVLDPIRGKKESHSGHEETCLLLLFGYLSKKAGPKKFCNMVRHCYAIPDDFVEVGLPRFPGKDLMSKLQDAVLTLYNYDDDLDDTDVYQTLVKGVNLLAKFPFIVCYTYQNEVHHYGRESLFIHYANPEYFIVENFLSLLRKDRKFTSKEADLLDTILTLHANHDGGNNSTFTNVAITSTGTDIYSMVCGSIGSLRGPCYDSVSVKVAKMTGIVPAEAGGYDADDKKIRQSAEKLIAGELYDHSGPIYGSGHAVYVVSDPRAEVLKACCMGVAKGQKHVRELDFYVRFGRIAKEVMEGIKGRALPANVDFYSGFAYGMLRIPKNLYTPLFVCSRVMDWVAHSTENKLYDGHIMRPAAKYVGDNMDYVSMPER